MSQSTSSVVSTSQESEAALPAERPAVSPWHEVARKVQRDSERDADEYLEGTIVPFGGE